MNTINNLTYKTIIQTENTTVKTSEDRETVILTSIDGENTFLPIHVIKALALTFLTCGKTSVNPKKKFTLIDEALEVEIPKLENDLLYQYENYYIVSSTETPILLLHVVSRAIDLYSHEVIELDRKIIFAIYKYYFN